jgi:hypothetical protein
MPGPCPDDLAGSAATIQMIATIKNVSDLPDVIHVFILWSILSCL